METPRLRLRRWRPEDLEPFARINADPRVMEYFLAPLSRAETQALIERIEASIDQRGFGFWACERREDGKLLGMVGLAVPPYETPFSPCVEVGWRLTPEAWGQGYAPEAARRCLQFAFETLKLPEVVSFTTRENWRSRRVMEKIGMIRDEQGDFDHPRVPEGHVLRPHVLYRIRPA